MKQPWDQQSKESTRAFAVFVAYRDMGLKRSFSRLAKDLKKNPSSIAELSKRYNWQQRVVAWDAHVDRVSQQSQIEEVKAMKVRQIDLALKAQKVAEKGLKKLLRQLASSKEKNANGESISPYMLRPDGLAKLLDGGCRLERLNRDVPEQNMELLHPQNFDNFNEEELETFKGLLIKSGQKHE